MELLEELQVTDARVSVLLSLKVPVAVKRWLKPADIDGLAGLIAMETKPEGVSVLGW